MFLRKIKKYIFNSDYRAIALDIRRIHILEDEEFLKRKFRLTMGYDLDLSNPKTFNEKLQWLKLNDRKPIYTTMVDKYAVKRYIANRVGERYVIPTLGVWDKFEDIDFDELPMQFVLKCTHDSGTVIICKNKSAFDYQNARKILNTSLKRNFFRLAREWPYKNVQPRIIAEKYITDEKVGELRDYKIYTFNGIPKILGIYSNRWSDEKTKVNYYDMNFNMLDFHWGYNKAAIEPKIPKGINKMIELSQIMSEGTYQLRVDFYEVGNQIYLGELTFFDGGGFERIEPKEWDYLLGSWIKLPGIDY